MKISVIGLGKLGASMVAGFASRGFDVTGVDINADSVNALKCGKAPVKETDLEEYLYKYRDKVSATLLYSEAISKTDITFVIVPTPSLSDGSFSLDYAKDAFIEIGKALKEKVSYHVIVLTSTVLPGSTRSTLIPILEKYSGKLAGKDFGICYNPEFIALGSVIKDFLNPDFYLLGQYDKKSGDVLESVHNLVSENKAPVKRMSLENAELAKISINSFVTLKISYANIMALLCENIPSGDVDIVSDALGLDSRIGRKYLTGGPGFAGPCFPRDNVALNFFGKQVGVDTSLLMSNHNFNQNIANYHFKKIISYSQDGDSIAILGLSYKENSHITEEAEGLKLARMFAENGFINIICHDSLVSKDTLGLDDLNITNRLQDVYDMNPQIIVICTNDKTYLNLEASRLTKVNDKKVTVIDLWRKNKQLSQCDLINYVQIGVNV
jgi:UDPglucose 6-dehydrogenase